MQKINGKSLVRITADVAIECGRFSKVIVTSESQELLQKLPRVKDGGPWRHKRDAKLAGGRVSTAEVCRDVLRHEIILPESFCLLIPTVPLRVKEDLRAAYGQFKNNCLMSLSQSEVLPEHLVQVHNNRVISSPSINNKRQNHKYYHHDGYLIMCNTQKFFEVKDFYDMAVTPWYTPAKRNLDINTMDDLMLARWRMKDED